MLHSAGANGIEHDVSGQLKQVALPLYEDRFETPLQNMSDSPVSTIEPLGVGSIQKLHAPR